MKKIDLSSISITSEGQSQLTDARLIAVAELGAIAGGEQINTRCEPAGNTKCDGDGSTDE